MTQQPFSRPGAIDLSGLSRPAPSAGSVPAGGAGGTAAGGVPGGGAYSVEVTEANFQAVLEASLNAPVVLVVISPSRAPQSVDFGRQVAAAVEEYDGRFLAAIVDVDQVPSIASALQVQAIPVTYILLDGRPATQPLPGVLQADELRTLFQQLGQQLTMQGVSGRHAPHALSDSPAAESEGEPGLDPRYAPAQEALEAGDIDLAVAEYERLVEANPADAEAAAGLAMAKVLQRTRHVDLQAARDAAAGSPDDVDAQTLVADLDLLGGHVDDAFSRLVGLVSRTSGDDRNKAREHLVGLFAAVGNDDPRVLQGRRALASALF